MFHWMGLSTFGIVSSLFAILLPVVLVRDLPYVLVPFSEKKKQSPFIFVFFFFFYHQFFHTQSYTIHKKESRL